MPNFDHNSRFDSGNRPTNPLEDSFAQDEDFLMEQILENMNTTPLGKVLKKIASLPEIRKEKVLEVRRQLTQGKYDLNGGLDVAVDKVIEHLMT
ncbi:MAG: flagellar biosynthesis anti-sigma factor FlgM [Planctomycetota bacterium]